MNNRHTSWLSYVRAAGRVALTAGLGVTLWACVSHPLTQPQPDPVQESDAQVTIVPMRHLDLLFMIDNSPSMQPKQDKMKAQFPKLIDALRDPGDGSLPDLRIGILDSDLGAGLSSQCTTSPNHGDRGVFQMRGAEACGAGAEARWLEYTKNQPVNFQGDVSEVFGCLAGNLGVAGCGFEHQLGALEWAFYLDGNQSQWDFLRPEAYLGIVILTDEDDCSAPYDTSMFNNRERAEAWSLRCATRAHRCDGVALGFPTAGPVSVPYASCRARDDATCDSSQVDTSVGTTCNPLLKISDLADAVKRLKGGDLAAEEKILVAAIYGTPRAGDSTPPVYKIDLAPDPTPTAPADAKVWDYWPICYDPAFPPSGSDFDKTAAEHGATGGLRIDAFLREFPAANRRSYSICESDYGPAMAGIGDALTTLMGDLCVPFKLVDKSTEPGLQADCRVAYRIPKTVVDQNGNASLVYEESPRSLPACDARRAPDCWEVVLGNPDGTEAEKNAAKRCPAKGSAPSQMVNVVRKPDSDLPDGTKAVMQCLTCVEGVPGLAPRKGCNY
jgi:hypothetical protein